MTTPLSRRSFVVGTGLATAAVALPALAQAGAMETYDVIVIDPRFAASRRFAAEHAHAATRLVDSQSDFARLWYAGLREQLARKKVRLAGVTTWADFTVASGCAAELRLRVKNSTPVAADTTSLFSWVIA